MTTTTEGAAAGAKPAAVDYQCPKCGWTGAFDSRFPCWCQSRGHNADPLAPEPESRWKARAEARRRAKAEALYERLRDAENLRPASAAGIAVTAISAVVHLVTLSLPVGAVLLVIWTQEALYAWVLAVLAVLITIAVRPRLGAMLRRPKEKNGGWVRSQDAPRSCAAPGSTRRTRRTTCVAGSCWTARSRRLWSRSATRTGPRSTPSSSAGTTAPPR